MYEGTRTLYTPDGKLHTLLGSVTLEAIVREYAGEEAALMVEEMEDHAIAARYLLDSDLKSYEASLEHWHDQVQGWKEIIDETLKKVEENPRSAKKTMADVLKDLSRWMNNEL